MARQDMDIKGDAISELEDIIDPHQGINLLDALVVEDLAVHKGEVDLTLVFEPDRGAEAREALKHTIEELLSDIEGVEAVRFMVMERSQMLYEVLGGGEKPSQVDFISPSQVDSPPPSQVDGGALSLSQLIANVEETPSGDTEAEEAAQTRLYSGGGCAAGTVDQAVVRDAVETPVPTQPKATTEARPTGEHVQVSLDAWSALQLENQALTTRNQALEARLAALQNALRAMIDEPF